MDNNRFTQTKFNNAASKKVAEGRMLAATITTTSGTVWNAAIVWKKGFQGDTSVTAFSESALRSALLKLDSSVKFFDGRPSIAAAVSTKDEAILEGLRTDESVSDARYRSACRALNQPIKARPNFNEQRVAPVAVIGLQEQGTAMLQFMQQHPELAEYGHEDYNVGLIQNWHTVEQVQVTPESLAQAYAEIHSHGMFRDRTSGMRGGNIVRPFDMGLIRSDRAKNTPIALRAVTPDQARQGWSAQKADVLVEARRRAKEQRPDLFDARFDLKGESGEARKLIDQIVLQMAREQSPAFLDGKKSARDTGYRG
jgi:hypothetical protein